MNRPSVDQLAPLFPSADFEFGMSLGRGDIREFFAPSPDAERLREERRGWFAESPGHYFGYEDSAGALVEEFVQLGIENNFISPALAASEPKTTFRALAESLEDETMLLRRDDNGSHVLVAGAVCFPSAWSLPEKMGKPLAEIHDPVPTVNQRFASKIDAFLTRMKPGTAWERSNWGLSRSPELNQHPSRKLPRLDASVELTEVFFRLEQQLLAPLPTSGGTVFALRLFVYSLTELLENLEVRNGFARALRTMPEEIAIYKGVAPARERIVSFL